MRTLILVSILATVAIATCLPVNEEVSIRALTGGRHGTSRKIPTNYKPTNRMVTENFVEVRIDKFNPQNRDNFLMRYYSNPEFYVADGPIFIFIGGAEEMQTYFLEQGMMYDMAEQMNAWMFAFEVRYYGKSIPEEDVSVENLKYLTNDHALADLIHFVTYTREKVVKDKDAKVILVGSGYGATLATWIRSMHPHLVNGVWSSSGLHEAIYDFQEFTEAFGGMIRRLGSDYCYNRIWRAFRIAQNLIDGEKSELMYDLFNICDPLDIENPLEIQYFFRVLMEAVEMFVLDNDDLEKIKEECQYIEDPKIENSLAAFANWFNKNFLATSGCVVTSIDKVVERFQDDSLNSTLVQSGARQWLYQQCTELGWFLTTDSDEQPFGDRVTLELHVSTCAQIFGDWINNEALFDQIKMTNDRFGGKKPKITHAYFTNGGEDPWRYASITETLNDDAVGVVIPSLLKSADLMSMNDIDTEELTDAKLKAWELVEKWITEVDPRKV